MLLFRIVCFMQLLLTAFLTFTSLITFVRIGRFYFLLESIFFMLMASLAILGLQLLYNNYPDKAVAGRQKAAFNWLYLANFLLLAFLFGLVFSEWNEIELMSILLDTRPVSLPFNIWIPFLINVCLLAFQFIILYGLYVLRRQLYINAYNARQGKSLRM